MKIKIEMSPGELMTIVVRLSEDLASGLKGRVVFGGLSPHHMNEAKKLHSRIGELLAAVEGKEPL